MNVSHTHNDNDDTDGSDRIGFRGDFEMKSQVDLHVFSNIMNDRSKVVFLMSGSVTDKLALISAKVHI